VLSQSERQALAEIEEQLRDSDPDLARRMEHAHRWSPEGLRRIRRMIGLAGLAVAFFVLAAASATRNADVAVLGAGVLLADALWWAGLAVNALIRKSSSALDRAKSEGGDRDGNRDG
jgi:hypothetical protein